MWDIYTLGYYSVARKQKFEGKWMENETITPSDGSQTTKYKYYISSLICDYPQNTNIIYPLLYVIITFNIYNYIIY